jgi:hypothetical protein
VSREKIDDCFDYVIQLLDEVIDSQALPVVVASKSAELGRFTHAAACTLKAKVCVYRASPLFNGNTDYNNFKDHNNEHFFNQTENPEHWVKALEACRTAIDACAEGGNRLFQIPDYITQMTISDTTRLVNTLRSSVAEQWNVNVETIWANTSNDINSMAQNLLVQLQAGSSNANGTASVPFSTVELFYSNHGVPIEEDMEWINSGKYENRFERRTGDEGHKYYIAKDEVTAAMNFDREPRFYSTLGFDRGKWNGNNYLNVPDEQTPFVKNRWGEYSSFRAPEQYNATGYFAKKMVSMALAFTSANAYANVRYPAPDLRYSSLLLYFAEALNETTEGEYGRPSDEVYSIIDQVRARAGLEGVVDSWRKYATDPDKPFSKKGMRDIIQRERKIELACEGQYYWDSRRWKTAVKEQNRIIQGWNVMSEEEKLYYLPVTVYIQQFTLRDYFSPIGEKYLIENPKLIQNPGY